ncbi:hypothetical protein L6267_03720 [Candidatus Parcubacteria bacterium]|nr:hypothetical protein [Candidatus Parcubacteria bacterium]
MITTLDETQKNRYEKIVKRINEIWKLEKKKFGLRDTMESIRAEISNGFVANSSLDYRGNVGYVANIAKAREREASSKQAIEEIKSQQLEVLKKIEEIILL